MRPLELIYGSLYVALAALVSGCCGTMRLKCESLLSLVSLLKKRIRNHGGEHGTRWLKKGEGKQNRYYGSLEAREQMLLLFGLFALTAAVLPFMCRGLSSS